MVPANLVVDEHPAAEDVGFLDDRINEFNFAATQIYDDRELAIFIRDANGQIVAGLYGWTWGGCGYVDKLWVRDDLRGKGYGTQLLVAAEREAVIRGCFQMILGTHSFQAPEFYSKFGYQICGVIDNYPIRYKDYVLKKPLK